MIIGIGTDLCEIGRIRAALDRFGDRFAQRILDSEEFRRYGSHRDPAAYLAKRFAAKEAFSKAMGTGIGRSIGWHGVGVENDTLGRPALRFSADVSAYLRERGVSSVHVSITDETGLACAFVVVEGRS